MTQHNLFLFLFLFLFLVPTQQAISADSSPKELIFTGFKHSTNLTLHGGATIEPNGALRLTNRTQRVYGQAFYSEPFRLGVAESFSAWFAFAAEPEYPKLGGHGLTFAISSVQPRPNVLPSQYLGLLNSTTSKEGHVVAVEFDTVRDFEFNDPNDNHVGLDVDSLKSVASAPVSLSLESGRVIAAWIDYDSARKEMTVRLSPLSFKTEPNRTVLTCSVDLSRIFLDRPTYVGFTASTGLLASSHYILGWSFKVNGKAKRLDSFRPFSGEAAWQSHRRCGFGLGFFGFDGDSYPCRFVLCR